jgi:adenosylcobinamide amidohydrolase
MLIPLYTCEQFRVERDTRSLKVTFLNAHRVLSTCAIQGGERTDLQHILNHQSCEGSAQHPIARELHLLSREQMHTQSCVHAGLDFTKTALLGTAANMDYASVQHAHYDDAQVTAIATAGVEGNAGRAGDPSQWHEGEQGYVPIHATPGTINIILLFHQTISSAALARSVVTLTEAKTAALLDLAVPSRYGKGLATGTGTDQFAIACPLSEKVRFHWTGKHAKLGELVATSVKAAVIESLRWQNGLEFSRTRSLFHALGRYGITEEALRSVLNAFSDTEPQRPFLLDSITMWSHDPHVSAVGYAIAAILDRSRVQGLPEASVREAVLWQCALLAVSVAGKPNLYAQYVSTLQTEQVSQESFLPGMVARALVLGWSGKWEIHKGYHNY